MSMKAKIYSWLLASAYWVWGIGLLLFIPRFQAAYVGFNVPVPFLVKVMFIAGPFGCLLITALTGAVLALNSHRFHIRFVSLILTVALLAWVGYVADVVFPTFTSQLV